MVTQGRLAKLQAEEANIRTTLISMKSMLLPHMEVLKHELSISKDQMSWDANISIEEGLVDLVVELEIQLHTLEVDRSN